MRISGISINTIQVSVKGFLIGLTIVLIIYFVIDYIYKISETEIMVPQAKYISCMVIYAVGYIYSTIKILLLRELQEKFRSIHDR